MRSGILAAVPCGVIGGGIFRQSGSKRGRHTAQQRQGQRNKAHGNFFELHNIEASFLWHVFTKRAAETGAFRLAHQSDKHDNADGSDRAVPFIL